ncbi:MAG TPA: demethoxyubiquinone hydroxylase family protein, partial [Phycisphaerae bacterium]|nr:demethoxyubiquinone hydroxylase family protein [Phycisphaerae bacterium]
GLRTLNTLELMAANTYRFQISGNDEELDRYLVAAMLNEMTHYQDFQVRLYEYGFRPNPFRWTFWIVGFVFGFTSRIRGRKAILTRGIWVETKAVEHYGRLLDSVEWDEDTRKVLEKDRADERGHVARWRALLGES